ncbi:MAG: hypothetical protein ACRDRT_01875 [Pseudonocardiaceae bacterium]
MMSEAKDYGTSADGTKITEEIIERIVAEAEAGYDLEKLLKRRRGRPLMHRTLLLLDRVDEG